MLDQVHENFPGISVVIPTMNRPESLNRTLAGYANGSRHPDQVIIVDQSPEQETQAANRKALQELPSSIEGIYIYQAVPSSSTARNRGIEKATREVVVFSDDDVDVSHETLENVVQNMVRPEVALIAGWDIGQKKSRGIGGYIFLKKSLFRKDCGYVMKSMLGRYPDSLSREIPTEWAMGYFFVVRNSLLQRWNIRWDDRLSAYAYGEDLDFSMTYCRHARAANLRCILTPEVAVRHLVSSEWRTPSYQATTAYVNNREYLRLKHNPGWQSYLAVRWTNYGELLFRLLKRRKPFDMLKAILGSPGVK